VEDSLVFIQPFVTVCKWAAFGYFTFPGGLYCQFFVHFQWR